ncbi:MAG: ATP-binding protein [Ignavibacteria bacterium]|nr:ATP-binding protein [Ignavibacteria bacterium]
MIRLSWRKKLFTFFALVALIPLTISGWNMIGITSDEVTNSTNESLAVDAGTVASHINNSYTSLWINPLKIIKSGLESPDLGGNEKAAIISGATKKIDDLICVELFFLQGEHFTSALRVAKDTYVESLKKKGLGENEIQFPQALIEKYNSDQITFGTPFYAAGLGTWVVITAIPIKIAGSPKSLLMALIDMKELVSFTQGFYSGSKNRALYLLDKEGHRLFSKESENLSSLRIVQDIKTMIASKSRMQGATNYKNEKGEAVVGCYAFPENIEWAVVAEIKEADAYQMVGKIKLSLLLWVIVGLGIAMTGGLLFSNDISKPIIKLSKVAETISSGNFDVDVEYKGKDSIGVLGSTLLNMSRSLKSSFEKIAQQNKQLEEYNRTLEHKVEERTLELKDKNTALEDTLTKLKETQEQLVMSQKLASLGQLTAGIAHEIKNPLNFVNNFAKLSVGLVDELKEELDRAKGTNAQPDYGYVEEVLGDIETNVTKISEHGNRADNIVRNMLEHSRMDSGDFSKTDINKLIDESVHLAFHGVRSQVAEFNCSLNLQYDKNIIPCNANPQALSQVFINLFNNAFYAMNKRKLTSSSDYMPELVLSSKDTPEFIEICIRDNGTGIPQKNLQKIFEPFFTTKPTGEGTGLGLSISFDIVSQMHRGDMSVNSEEGQFTEFKVKLPKNLTSI